MAWVADPRRSRRSDVPLPHTPLPRGASVIASSKRRTYAPRYGSPERRRAGTASPPSSCRDKPVGEAGFEHPSRVRRRRLHTMPGGCSLQGAPEDPRRVRPPDQPQVYGMGREHGPLRVASLCHVAVITPEVLDVPFAFPTCKRCTAILGFGFASGQGENHTQPAL